MIKKSVIIDVDVKGEDELKSLDKSIDGVGESVGGVNTQLDGMGGAAGAAVKGVKSLGLAFKALLANPIVLVITGVVGALVGLYNAFKRTAVGGEAISKVFDGIAAAIGPVLDSLGKLASGLVEFFKGNFSEAIKQMSGAFDGLTDSIVGAYNNATKLVELTRELSEENRKFNEAQAEIRKEMELQRSILDDADKSTQERIAANERLNDLNKELLEEKANLNDLEMDIAERRLADAGDDYEAAEEAKNRISELKVAYINAEAEKFRIDKEYVVKRNELYKLGSEEEQARQREENEFSLELTSEKVDLVLLEGEREVEGLRGLASQKEQINEQIDASNQELYDNEKAIQEARMLMTAQLVGLASQATQLIASEAEEGTKLKKGVAVAGIALDVAAGFMNGLIIAQQGAAGLGAAAPFAMPIFYATQVLAVLTAANKAKDVLNTVPVGVSSPSVSAPSMPTSGGIPSFNTIGTSGNNQIVDAINGQNDTPIQAYVIGNDVTTQQALDRNITNTASFG